MPRPRRFLWLAFLLLACSDDSVDLTLPPTNSNVIGTFTLTDAHGVAPPFPAFTTDTDEWHLQSDVIVIATDGSWNETTDYAVVSRATRDSVDKQILVSGPYAVVNGRIVFTMMRGESGARGGFSGSVVGNTLIVLFEGRRFTYTR